MNVVAGRAFDRPGVGQPFPSGEDLLDDDISGVSRKLLRPLGLEFIKTLAEHVAITGRIGQAVDMVDAHTIESAPPHRDRR